MPDASRTLQPVPDGMIRPDELPTFRAHARFQGVMRDYWEMAKPGISFFIVLTAAAGYFLASGGAPDLTGMAAALVGIGLTAAGAGALNHFVERDVDARMVRTSGRPLPAERVRPGAALLYGLGLGAAGTLLLLATVGLVPATLAAASLLTYIFVYTPLKRRTPAVTLVGAVPGALPTLAGWTAAGAAVDAAALGLFGTVYFWQIPHFLALAWIVRADYRAGGLRILTVEDPDGRRTGRHATLHAAALLAASTVPFVVGTVGWVYLVGMLLLGAWVLSGAVAFLRRPDNRTARRLFLSSLGYVPGWLVLTLVDGLVA